LAQALVDLARGSASGIHHYTQAGIASWYDFAAAIGEEATAAGLLDKAPLVRPIRSEAFPTPARRPSFSVLDTAHTYAALGQMPDHWRVQLRKAIAELKEDSLG
jgi:dTDP-4-dehydrorhamnose reductase